MERLLQSAANVKIIENRQKAKSTQFVVKARKLHPYGSLCLESLLQIAANVKIIDKRPKARSTVMKFENFIFNV